MKAVMLSGGGIDSTVLLVFLRRLVIPHTDSLHVLHVDYGQKAAVNERTAVKLFADRYAANVKYLNMNLLPIANAHILRGSGVGKVKAENKLEGRNCALVALAATYASTIGADRIYVGFHSYPESAPPAFPDETPEAVEAMQIQLKVCYAPNIQLLAPFHALQKIDILALGLFLDDDVARHSFTCYEGGSVECGVCIHCVAKSQMLGQLESEPAGRAAAVLERIAP